AGRRSPPVELTVTNPAPDALSGMSVLGGFDFYRVVHDTVTAPDLLGTKIWASKTQGFTPGPSNVVYTGQGTFHDVEGETATTYYVKAAAYDTFSDDAAQLN